MSAGAIEDRILDEAMAHLRRYGARRTTVLSIAQALGVSHAALYRYFPSKAELFDAAMARALKPLEAEMRAIVDAPDPAADKLERLVHAVHRAYRGLSLDDPELFELLSRAAVEGAGPAANIAPRCRRPCSGWSRRDRLLRLRGRRRAAGRGVRVRRVASLHPSGVRRARPRGSGGGAAATRRPGDAGGGAGVDVRARMTSGSVRRGRGRASRASAGGDRRAPSGRRE
ncbi:MAG: TetR/AcrR family transcriptional regulator [Rhodoblastus sp.]|nr:MAG: TetR/AcrR family transcriptional regulator [Rhodoblastus sp.]